MPNYNVEQSNLSAVEDYINKNNTTTQNNYIGSKPPIFRVQELNYLYSQRNRQEGALEQRQQEYDAKLEQIRTETDPVKKETLIEEAEKIEKDIQSKKTSFSSIDNDYNQQMEQARRYIKIDQRNGRIEAQIDNGNEQGNWIYIDPEGNVIQKNENEQKISGNIMQGDWNDLKFQRTTVVSSREQKQVEDALNILKSGEEIPSAKWIEFENILNKDPQKRYLLQNITNDIYESNFRYNIERSPSNQTMYDIRNYNNFRSSNRTTSTNPTTAENTNYSKSFYMSRNDFYWSQNYNDIKDQLNKTERQSIQNIILNEYQPTLQYNLGSDLFGLIDNLAAGGVKLFVDHLGMNETLTKIGGLAASYGAGKYAEYEYNKTLNNYSEHPEQLYNAQQYAKKINPMYYIERLFNKGRWLNTFELPFVANSQVKNDYLKLATDPGSWNIGGLTDKSGNEGMSNVILHDRISISLPASPTFSVSNPHQATMGPIELDFFIINKDDQYLDKNFQFMQALFAGTQWLSMELGVVAASNVYQVVVPGRFMIHWASLQSKFEAMGKLRTNEYMYAQYGNSIKMIQRDTLWPQTWHVSLTIKPLTPWNFNTHMSFYNNGYGSAERQRLYNNIAEGNYANTFTTTSPKELAQAMERKDKIEQELFRLNEVMGKKENAINDITGSPYQGQLVPISMINDLRKSTQEARAQYQQLNQDTEMMKEVYRIEGMSQEEIENNIAMKKIAFKEAIEKREAAVKTFEQYNKDIVFDNGKRSNVTPERLIEAGTQEDEKYLKTVKNFDFWKDQVGIGWRNNDTYRQASEEGKRRIDEEVFRQLQKEQQLGYGDKRIETISKNAVTHEHNRSIDERIQKSLPQEKRENGGGKFGRHNESHTGHW